MFDVMGIGMSVMDQLVLVDGLPTYNQGAKVLETSWQYGGKAPGGMIAVARLGRKGAMIGSVGGNVGALVRKDFERHGIDCSYLLDRPNTQTVIVLAMADQSTGGRSLMGMPSGMDRPEPPALQELDQAYILDAKVLLISNFDEVTLQAAKWYKAAGKPVVIDADWYADETFNNMHLVDHFIASEFFYEKLFGKSENFETNLRELKKRLQNSKGVVVVTLGEKGLVGIDDEDAFFRLPAFKVEVKDTTGAGDVFHGAYASGLTMGLPVQEICRLASGVSAIKCTRLGGRAGLPSLETVRKFLETGEIDYSEIDERVAYYRKMPLL
ncbi:MAG: PfkB family carbohydrate kinase [Christensenellaceae bacterium]|jgi:sulfofructose kinase|nr:PfkB family carbohydrate kinase [Christensenellaceae bacterium]